MDTWICPFGSSFRNYLVCQRLPYVTRSWCRSRRNTNGVHTMAYDVLTNVPVFSWCFMMVLQTLPNFGRVWGLLNHVSICGQFRDSVTLELTLHSRSIYIALVVITQNGNTVLKWNALNYANVTTSGIEQMVGWLLGLYVLATFKAISGWVSK